MVERIRIKPVAPARATALDEVAGCLSKLETLATSIRKQLSDAQMQAAIQSRLKAEDAATLSRSVR
jgi:hypothetical protein